MAARPFGRRIDRGGEAGRPGTDDRDVVEAIGIDRPHHADAAGKLELARIAQQLPARAQHDRQLAGIDMEALDQRLRLGILLRVDPLVGMPVAGEEALEPKRVAVADLADDDRPAGALFENADPAQDQRAHDPLAELGFGDQQRAQPLRWNVERADRLARIAVDQRRAARKLRQFPDHRARPGAVERLAADHFVIPDEIDRSGQDHEQAMAALADLEQRLPGIVTAGLRRTGASARSRQASARERSGRAAFR